MRQKPLPKMRCHISFSTSKNSAAGKFAGDGILCSTAAAARDAAQMSDQESLDSAFLFPAAWRFILFRTARRHRQTGSFTTVRTRSLARPQGQQHTTAAHSAAVPPATSATRLLGFAGSLKFNGCLLTGCLTGAAVKDIRKINHGIIFGEIERAFQELPANGFRSELCALACVSSSPRV